MQAERIVETILLRDRHRRDRTEYLMRMTCLAGLFAGFLVGADVIHASKGETYKFVMTDSVGKVLPLIPLERANATEDEVATWTIDAITRAYTFDFANYRRQFLEAQKTLTLTGWDGFERSLKESGNFVAVKQNRYVTTAAPSGPARVLSSGILQDSLGNRRWGWTIEFPMLITYRNARQSTSQDLTVKVVVVRMPEYINGRGLGIRQVIAQ